MSRQPVRLDAYRPPAFLVDTVDLDFHLDTPYTTVTARLACRRKSADGERMRELHFDGRGLETLAVSLDGSVLDPLHYRIEEDRLTLVDPPDRFVLETVVRIRPDLNTVLEGLYLSAGNYCTQCEAEGFRRITWYPDRPDVLARFTTTISADAARYPVLLSNGNPTASGRDGDRHWATWTDPYAKPGYLFALVAGDLACIERPYTTASGREVTLRIFVEPHNRDRCEHAMDSLVKAMSWDERVFGLEYDLDIFMIVAVDDFNMGAMENKGLNIFNSKYVLARPDTATDRDYAAIEGVVAHEYFHNWTGNRVTCRDWFQLSLKEGLTVFRDQEFSSDMGSRPVNRVQDVQTLRTHQFPEDAGPMAHPVRPDSYIEISNFYTVTIYNKGAEVIRMLHTLVGAPAFRAGVDLYLRRHDGAAATTDDFVAAVEDASGADLGQFRRWYDQAGTPEVSVSEHWNEDTGRYRLELSQHTPATPEQPRKTPFHIPLRLALLDADGRRIALEVAGDNRAQPPADEIVYSLRDAQATIEFENVHTEPLLSIGRDFSAPIKLRMARSDPSLARAMSTEDDPFNRWDAAQEYAAKVLERDVDAAGQDASGADPAAFLEALRRTLVDDGLDAALRAQALALPSETNLADRAAVVDPDAIHAAREGLRRMIARHLRGDLEALYASLDTSGPYRFDAASMGRRSLRNAALGYLVALDEEDAALLCERQFERADNMTDAVAALACLADRDGPARDRVFAGFESRWSGDPLVMDKWFALQAMSSRPDTLARVQGLMRHPGFDIRNPNRVRSLIGAFCHGNQLRFNAADGSGHAFLADRVLEIEACNPQVAARLVGAFSRWRRFDERRQESAQTALGRILAHRSLSRDVYEIASKTLV